MARPAIRDPQLAGSRVAGLPECGSPYNPVRMLGGALVVVGVALLTVVVSRFMWWACRRSAAWSMAAGVILAVLALGGAVVIAWLMTRVWYGS